MKIGFVIDDTLDKPDGVQQYVLVLGKWLTQVGHEVHYLCGESHRSDIRNLHTLSKNSHVRFNGNRLSVPRPANPAKIKSLLETEQFDVLHVQMPFSPMLAGKIIKYAPNSTAIVGTFHIVPFSWLERIAARGLHATQLKSLKRFQEIICVSKPAAKFAKSAFRLNAHVLPNVVDLRSFEQSKPLKQFNDGKINIIFLGRLVERKGSLQLLEAIQALHAQHLLNNVRIVICGKGPLQKTLQKYIQNNHLSAHVHFAGFVSEIEKGNYLASADIAVFPSTGGESFGIVLIEAMAAGAGVVIGGDNVGYRSVMSDRPEQLIDPNNTAVFAQTLKHFIMNSRARRSAQAWQHRHVMQYDVRTVGPEVLALYRTAIAKAQI